MLGDTLDDAMQYVRSIAFSKPGRGGYCIGSIMQELGKYQRTDDETYAEFATRFLSPEDIKRVWKEKADYATKVIRK